ncbi:patatin-like phospholipase family protein [Caldanaerobacter subterraneus]|uniref:Patatin-like phospholipase family protein n=1 Tax=Caldanaerobacter subterraneus TaxID=911092 RepID=A0A7Y2PM73_9THEO|nr:patatin-like phospholipase family protein [Caldanaerobacter subterraneus]NNG68061.1 patatin-like phospholipase family protein [Caldanaerobacter subterraneus]
MYGVVLEGGGARGAYQIGVYKALIEEGIEVKGIAGTSVGALNGAILVQGDFDKAYEIWENISYSRVIKASDEEIEKFKKGKLDREDILLLIQRLRGIIREGGLDITPLRNLLEEVLDEEKIRSSGKDFAIVTVSLSDLKPMELYIEDIPYGKLIDYLMASAYLPVFKREKIDGKSFLDGGVYNNLPANLLIDKGYKDLIIIRTGSFGIVKKIGFTGLNVLIISPKEDLGGILEFDKETARYNLTLGYYDGLKALRRLKGSKYYIKEDEKEEFFIHYLLNLEKEKIKKLKEIFDISEEVPDKRALFEFIIPKLSALLNLGASSSYEEIFLYLLENLAESYKIDRFKIYTYGELMEKVREKVKTEAVMEGEENVIEKIVKKVFMKSEILKEAGKVIFG